ncbi:MAG: hypothetical protein RLZZ276_1530 [Pseudomonadota bacterium]|jgi:hypothetical protein
MTRRRLARNALLVALAAAAGCGPVEPVSVAWNAAFIAASPVGTALVDSCDEFAPTQSMLRWCRLRNRLFASEEERQREERNRQPQRYACRRSLADIDCSPLGATTPDVRPP